MALSKNIVRLNRPLNQNIVCGMVLFCLPGIYTALTGLGAGGGHASAGVVANETNAILYGMFTVFAWLGGTFVNIFRPRISMFVGSLGYPLYIGGLWYYDRTGHTWFPLFAGAILGVLCGILVTCCGMISYAYAEESEKALYICMQWMIRAVGACVGASVSLSSNIHAKTTKGVSDPVYIAFIAIQCSSLLLSAFLIVDPRDVVRDDGTHLAIIKRTSVKEELKSLGRCFLDKRLLFLLPSMLSCEMALALISTVNGFYFNLRTRSLNNFCFQFIQLLGPFTMIWILDTSRIASRKTRGLIGVAVMGTVSSAACCGLLGWLHVTDYISLHTPPAADWSSHNWGGLFVIYLLFGLVYSGYQMTMEWVVSCLSNDPSRLAQYSGFARGMASLGMCLSFVISAQRVPTYGQVAFQFTLYVLGVIGMVWVLLYHIPQTNYFIEETTIAPHHVENEAFQSQKMAGEQLERETHEKPVPGKGADVVSLQTGAVLDA